MTAPPPEAADAAAAAPERWLDEIEAAVAAAEASLRERRWRELGEAVAAQRRCTHGLQTALERARLDAPGRARLDARVAAILGRRDEQLRRLERFHGHVGARLRELARFKFALRAVADPDAPRAVALDVER